MARAPLWEVPGSQDADLEEDEIVGPGADAGTPPGIWWSRPPHTWK